MERRYSCAKTLLCSYRQLVWFMMRETWRSESQGDFVRAMDICEERLTKALESGHYLLAIACARFLTIILELAHEQRHQDTKHASRFIRSYSSSKVSSEAVSDLQVIASRLSKRIEELHISRLVDEASSGKLNLRQVRETLINDMTFPI